MPRVYYQVKDPRTLELLKLAKAVISSTLAENMALLDDLSIEDFAPGRDH
jgi:hypothetical protein